MSMIGYVIGLGDRHLDNLLVDLKSGEIVHIDYNVCFEKGAKLRVPETVPFRMTQNLQHALGVTGVDGVFRKTCEMVLRELRNSRETLLTLLEAFIYDPLVDWTPNMKNEAEKEAMEKGICHSLLAARITELKVPLQNNQAKHEAILPQFHDQLENMMNIVRSKTSLESQVQQWHHEEKLLREAVEAEPEQVLQSLAIVYAEDQKHSMVQEQCTSAIMKRIAELSHWHDQHVVALETLRGTQLDKLRADLRGHDVAAGGVNTLAVAKAFLQSVHQTSLIDQGEVVHRELMRLVEQRRSAMLNCLDLMYTYRTIVTEYPCNVVLQNRCYMWRQWLQTAFTAASASTCQSIVEESQMSPPHSSQIETCRKFEDMLREFLADASNAHAKLVSKRNGLMPVETPPTVQSSALQESVQTALGDVRKFTSSFQDDSRVKSTLTLECATVRLLHDLLVKMRQQEDELNPSAMWSLSELCNTGDLAGRLLGLLREAYQTAPDGFSGGFAEEEYLVSLRPFSAAQNMFQRLDDLPAHVLSHVVPDIVRLLMNGDTSLALICERLALIVKEDDASAISKQLDTLLTELPSGSAILSAGQQMLTGVNSLFVALEQAFAPYKASCSPKFPLAFAGVIPALPAGHDDQSVHSMLIRKKVNVFHKLLSSCLRYAEAFSHQYISPLPIDDSSLVVDASKLQALLGVKSVVQDYCTHFYHERLAGAFSSSIKCVIGCRLQVLGLDVQQEAANSWAGAGEGTSLDALMNTALSGSQLPAPPQIKRLLQLLQSYATAQSKLDGLGRLDAQIALVEKTKSWVRLQLARFQWLRGEVLALHADPAPVMRPPRESVIGEIVKSTQKLTSVQRSLKACNDRFIALEQSTTQRLTWACGANRGLTTTLTFFNEAVAKRQQNMEVELKTCGVVLGMGNALTHFETYRSMRMAESHRLNDSNRELLKAYGDVLVKLTDVRIRSQHLEKQLPSGLKVYAPRGEITSEWMHSRLVQLPDSMRSATSELKLLLSVLPAQQLNIQGHVTALGDCMSETKDLMKEIGPLLEPVVKTGDVAARSAHNSFDKYESTCTSLLDALKLATMPDFPGSLQRELEEGESDGNPAVSQDVHNLATSLLEGDLSAVQGMSTDLGQLFEQLLSLETYQERTYELDQHAPTVVEGAEEEPVTSSKTDSKSKAKSGRGRQDRNAHAVGVWKRVRAKLEGKDSDSGRRRSVAEQVEKTIREATSADNLCRLYEGWTPWI